MLQRNLSPPAVVVKDGFGRPGGGRLTWSQPSRSDEQEIFYLHGAMHYYVDDHQVSKLEVGDANIVSQLESNLGAGRYPLVVTEGSRDDKEARIAQSAYLTYCHRRLARLNGALFIHGMANIGNDRHILDAIADKPSGIDAIYIGLFGGPSATTDGIRVTARELARTRANNGGRSLRFRFYQSETASVWG